MFIIWCVEDDIVSCSMVLVSMFGVVCMFVWKCVVGLVGCW